MSKEGAMDEYAVDLLPAEVLRLVRADARRRNPELRVQASKTYSVESDFDREEFGIGEDDDVALVSVEGLLEVAPRRGRGGWVLQLRAQDVVGVYPTDAEEDFEDETDMPIEAFEEQFLIPEKGEVEVVVLAEDREAWERFQRWLEHAQKE